MNKYSVNRDIAKTLFIILLYGGSYNKWLKENNYTESIEEITNFKKELKIINIEIVKVNPDLEEWVKQKDINNKKISYESSIVAYYLQEKEVQILEQLFIYSCDKGYIKENNVVLCADGLMIPKENYNEKILIEFE